jgi:hypothetical protein
MHEGIVMLIFRRAAAHLLALLGIIALLAGCTLSSKEKLVTDEESVTPLPASFAFFTYTDKAGAYVRTEEAAQVFTLNGKGYANPDGVMSAYFVPLEGNTYLLAASAADGSLYGVAQLFDTGVLEIEMVFDSGLEEALVAAAPPADIAAAIKVSEGGIEVTSRDALDFVIALIAEDKLPVAPLVAYVAESADSSTPASISRDGDGWTVTN